jgi:hypothetical protein
MLVVGIGIGLVMQVLVLAVQNCAPPKDVGVATSAATFFRSMGGSLGVALFGAIFASRLGDQLEALPPEVAERFSGGVNISPEQVHALPAEIRDEFLNAFVHALSPTFLVGSALTLVAFALSWMLKEIPLRGSTHAPATVAAEEAVAGGTGAEAIITEELTVPDAPPARPPRA